MVSRDSKLRAPPRSNTAKPIVCPILSYMTSGRRCNIHNLKTRYVPHPNLYTNLQTDPEALSHTMPSLAALTIHLFGFTCLVAGVHNLFRPGAALSSFHLPGAALPASNGNALAATAMGLYYHLAAFQENRAFFAATVPMRLLTAAVFVFFSGAEEEARGIWRVAGLWEGAGSLLTAAALVWEAKGL